MKTDYLVAIAYSDVSELASWVELFPTGPFGAAVRYTPREALQIAAELIHAALMDAPKAPSL